MAARNSYPVKGIAQETVLIPGQFTGNTTSNPSAALNIGRGWSVARTGTGTYVVTLNDKWPEFTVTAMPKAGAGGDKMTVILVAQDLAAKTFTLETQTNLLAADLATDEGVHFNVVARNSTVPPLRG